MAASQLCSCSLHGAMGTDGRLLLRAVQYLSEFQQGVVSGFLLIFFSELGDKTFFIALLLSLKQAKPVVFAGTFGALAVMTVISVRAPYACATASVLSVCMALATACSCKAALLAGAGQCLPCGVRSLSRCASCWPGGPGRADSQS